MPEFFCIQDPLTTCQRACTVRNQQQRLSRVLCLQGMQQFLLVQCIQRAGRLVHQADIRISEKHPRNADTLTLSARKPRAHLPHIGVIAIWQSFNKLCDSGTFCCCFDLFHRSIRLCNTNIFRDRRVKQVGILFQKRDTLMQFRKADLLNRDAIDEDLPFCRRIKPQKQTQDRGFSRAGLPGNADPVPFFDDIIKML